MSKELRLNLGCGNKRHLDFIGVDKYPCAAVDVRADLEEKLPFGDGEVTEVMLDNVIEHIRDIPGLMREIHRVCRPGAVIHIVTPHFASLASWRDPTHVHHLSYYSMDHFAKPDVAHYAGGGFAVEWRTISFGGLTGALGRLVYFISPKWYEERWCFIFRPSTLRFRLRVVKATPAAGPDPGAP